ncbi:taste receptor type 2 member 9-like [Xenopus laevis]|uniref:Taste receptor type 2 n=1 Tax=Xenopus laevis TaxID=8355 RepID=A0A8J0U7S5_XENLA|nr:taste receptor type 2 member 9-like [Xenopus laevis]
MPTSLQIYWAAVLIIAWPCGFILNSSIVAVYLSYRKKECDRILLTMACCNVLLLSLLAFDMTFVTYGLYILFDKELFLAITIILLFSINFSFWLTACLSVYYCLRLVNFSCQILIYLQRRISFVVTLFLLVSVLISWVINLPFIWTVQITKTNATSTYQDYIFNYDQLFMFFNIVFGSALPFIVTSLCIGICLISLLRHVQRMRQHISEFWSPQLKSHVKAFRTMLLLLILNLIFFTVFGSLYLAQHYLGDALQTVLWSGTMFIPSGQALILIFGKSKLARAWSKTMSMFGSCARNV